MAEPLSSIRAKQLSAAKRALLEQRLRGGGVTKPVEAAVITPRLNRESAPVSFAQQRLWFFDQLKPGDHLYNITETLRLKGALDVEALRQSLDEIVRRHDVLRTTFPNLDGQPVQSIDPKLKIPMQISDLRQFSAIEREMQVQRFVYEQIHWAFNLNRGPLLKVHLLRLDHQEHLLIVNFHHIISDGWSLSVFFHELVTLYQAYSTGAQPNLPELPIQYGDYSCWQRQMLQGDELERHLAYWKKQLAGLPVLQLSYDRPRPAVQRFLGDRHSILLPKSVTAALKALAQTEGATPFMIYLAAFKALLQRYTSQEDIAVGSPITNRSRLETQGLIGFFVNTLVMRTDLSQAPTFRTVVQRVKDGTLGAFAHQELPFEKLVEVINPERDASQNPLFQVMFLYQNEFLKDHQLPGLVLSLQDVNGRTAKFDLTLFMTETVEGLKAVFEYSTDLFDAATIVRLAGHFQSLLESVAADPDRRLSEINILTPIENEQLLGAWTRTGTNYPRDACVHELFQKQVDATPDAIALVSENERLTYRELNRRANKVASYLRSLGVGPDCLVGLSVERSIEMMVGILGILKAGGAYVPLDPRYPKDRLAFMLNDTAASVLLTQQRLLSALPETRARVICLDTELPEIAGASEENVINIMTPDHLAYVMYTSGSTGIPKGVCVPHRGVVRLVKNTNYLTFSESDVFLQFAPLAFDASTLEIWGPLLNGGRLVVFSGQLSSLEDLKAVIEKEGVTTLWLTAGLFHQIVEDNIQALKSVKRLLAGGDILSPSHVRKTLEALPDCQVINGYGPTESTTFSTCYSVPRGREIKDTVPIGRPISNTQIYILDPHMNPVPIGIPGELYVGGDGLARCYLNAPDLTAQKFIPHPFSKEPGARLYRTGDLGRWLHDGTIEFLGRIDHQVKIRGFRVEPGEIEAVLGKHPAIRENLILPRDDSFGNKRLVAYFVPRSLPGPSAGELRNFLSDQIPEYMMPSAFVSMESFPLTPNGKVNRRALPAPEQRGPELQESYVAPRNETETQLARMWSEVLGIQRIGVKDNFFELGGHSLLAVRLITMIKKGLNQYLPLTALFKAPTIEQLVRLLDRNEAASSWSCLVNIQPEGTKPPIFWIHTLGGGGGGGFFRYKKLAELLGPDQPSYGIQAPPEPFTTLQAMASHYIEAIRSLQPNGPYYLGGYCFGGNLAFEMAQQLQAQGQKVAFLAMLESSLHPNRVVKVKWNLEYLSCFVTNLCYWLAEIPELSKTQLIFRLRKAMAQLGRKILRRDTDKHRQIPQLEELINFAEYPEEFRKHAETHWRAFVAYKPRPYPGSAYLFRVKKQPLGAFDMDLEWKQFIQNGLHVHVVPGTHDGIFDEPFVRELASQMKTCLTQVKKQPFQPTQS